MTVVVVLVVDVGVGVEIRWTGDERRRINKIYGGAEERSGGGFEVGG